jgi:hypothetical protein
VVFRCCESKQTQGGKTKETEGCLFLFVFFFVFPVREFLSVLHVPHLITSLCTALVHVYMCVCVCVCVCTVLVHDCWPPITTYGVFGFHETRGLLQRRRNYTCTNQREKERKRYTELYSGGDAHVDESGCLLWVCSPFLFGFFFVFFFFFLSVFSEVNVCSMLMTPAVCIIM